MIDIIILYFLCQRIKKVVALKENPVWVWQIVTIMVWIFFELIGCIGAMLLGKSLIIVYLSGLLCAIGGFLFLQQLAQMMPDKNNEDDFS